MPESSRLGTYARFYEAPPDEQDESASTWYFRGANMVVAYSAAHSGAAFERRGQLDEYFVLLPNCGGHISAGGEKIEVASQSLTIVPPGESSVELDGDGDIWRAFTTRAADLVEKCPNNADYASQPPGIDPIIDWPEPSDGYRLRSYDLNEASKKMAFALLSYRSRAMMVNLTALRPQRRSPKSLSPHAHEGFQQMTLVISGTFIHHIRRPWGADSTIWQPDDHEVIASPSLVISWPPDVHTTQDVGTGVVQLADVFSPPRADFSLTPGYVLNADEYPLPAALIKAEA